MSLQRSLMVILRPTLRNSLLLVALLTTAGAAYAAFQLRQLGNALAEFDHEPLPASAAAQATDDTSVLTEPLPWTWTDESASPPAIVCNGASAPPHDAELRWENTGSYVVAHARTERQLLTWKYDRACNLVGHRSLPATILEATPRQHVNRPLDAIAADRPGMFYETTDRLREGCELGCNLRIWEAPYDERRSEHPLDHPKGIAASATARYIWWMQWNDRQWSVDVIDRQTHELRFRVTQAHFEYLAPIDGLSIEDDRLTVQTAVNAGKSIAGTSATRVWDLSTGELLAREITGPITTMIARPTSDGWHEPAVTHWPATGSDAARQELIEPTADATPDDVLPWTWTPEPMTHDSRCDGEWQAGCEPPRWCDGTTTAASIRRLARKVPLGDASRSQEEEIDQKSELTITQIDGLDLDTRKICTTQMHAAEVRFQLEEDHVAVFSQTPESLLSWRYDFDCNLMETRVLPAAVLSAAPIELQALPLVPRRTASGRGLYFETTPRDEDGCQTECSLRIHEAPYDARRSEHPLIAPRGIKTGATTDYIWWVYWNAEKWFVRVIDRETHKPLFAEEGVHERDASPIVGLRFIDDHVTVALASYPRYDIVQQRTRVYELPSGELLADERVNWGIPMKRRRP